MKMYIAAALIYVLFYTFNLNAQIENEKEIEVILIDAYVSPNPPHEFVLSFFTLVPVKSSVIIDNRFEVIVSDTLNEDHAKRISLEEMEFDSLMIPFYIEVQVDSIISKSESYTLEIPKVEETETSTWTSLFHLCLGGIVFFVPSTGVTLIDGEMYLNLGKELPIYNFYSGGYNYPTSYLSIEFTHTFGNGGRNLLRSGYKKIFEVPVIEFISPGVSVFTNFKGVNGFSPEITMGLFKISNVFTLYSRYRYNYQPGGIQFNSHEISIGLYSHFFSLNF